jgi:hypothetical protein
MDMRRAVSAPGYRDAHQPRRAGSLHHYLHHHPERHLSVRPRPAANMRDSRTCCGPADMARSFPAAQSRESVIGERCFNVLRLSSQLYLRVGSRRSAARIPQLWLCSSPDPDANGQLSHGPIHCRHMKPLATGQYHQVSTGTWIFDGCISAATVQTTILVQPQPGCATVGSEVQGTE